MNERLRLDGKVAIITGGGGGIGRAIALSLAEAGADVVVADIVPARCEETSECVSAMGRTAIPYPIDMMDADAVEALVADTDTQFGRVDILVNNAGGVTGRPFLEQSRRSWSRHIALNLVSMLTSTQAAARIMAREGRGGSIINVSSIEGTRAAPNFSVYAACKAGMISFTRTMAVELAEHGIRVNCISPDHTVTPGTRGDHGGPVNPDVWREQSDAEKAAMRELIPLGREGVGSECGDAALFLSSEMASYITGITLPIDGGTWASSGWVRNREGGWTLNQGLHIGPRSGLG